VIKTDASVSTLAANKIMYEVPEVVFGQVVDASGNESSVPKAAFDVKNKKGTVISSPDVVTTSSDFLASASASSINLATKVTYKKGVVTKIQGVDKLSVEQNQIISIDGNAARTVKGDLDEDIIGKVTFNAQGEISIFSPKAISIKSNENIDLDTPFFNSNTHATQFSFTGLSISLNGISAGYNGVDFAEKGLDLTNQQVKVRLKNIYDMSISAIKAQVNKLTVFM